MAQLSIFVLLSVFFTFTCAIPLQVGKIHVDEKRATLPPIFRENSLSSSTPTPEMTAGYPQLFRRKTTSLLAEALHMLSRVKDVKERRWLESFVHRLATLAHDLDTGPLDLQGDKGLADFGRSLVHNAGHLQEIMTQHLENTGGTVSESGPGPEELVSQLQGTQPAKGQHHNMLKTNKTPKEEADARTRHREEKLKAQKVKEFEKKKLLKDIFAQVQKLRELGGKPQEVFEILKRTRGIHLHVSDHPTEQVSEPNLVFSQLSTLAPSSGQLREAVTEVHPARTTAVEALRKTTGQDEDTASDETSDEGEDDLVKQLEEEKFILITTPGSRPDVEDQ